MQISSMHSQQVYSGTERIKDATEGNAGAQFTPARPMTEERKALIESKMRELVAASKKQRQEEAESGISNEQEDRLHIVTYKNGVDDQGFFAAVHLQSVEQSLRLPQESMLTLRMKTGYTNMSGGFATRPSIETPSDIPSSGFMKEGLRRYEALYEEVKVLGAGENAGIVDEDSIKRTINFLDRAFESYLFDAFSQAGFSNKDAGDASSLFGLAFRNARNTGATLQNSYEKALEQLREDMPQMAKIS